MDISAICKGAPTKQKRKKNKRAEWAKKNLLIDDSDSVANVTNSIHEMILNRQRRFTEHQKRVATLKERLDKLTNQVNGFKRTRRNIKSFNILLDKQAQVKAELATAEMDQPDLSVFYDDLKDFLQESKTEESNRTVEQVQLSSHRNVETTAGAPVFQLSQYNFLTWGSSLKREKATDEDQLFDNVLQADSYFSSTLDVIQPVAMIVEPTSTGEFQKSNANVNILADCLSHNDSIAERSDAMIMVTIGKSDSTSSGVENKNRLNVKMKDIRNMKNTSMLNFVNVEQRETTNEEQQRMDLVDFLNKRDESRSASQQPIYDDPKCDACGSILMLDNRSGMVSCPNENCGLTYSDGIDSHRVEPIRQEYHSKFEYLKSGHLMTLLNRFQGKESTVIPRDVVDKVVVQLFEREKITDMKKITIKKLKATLKKLALAKFYDHVWQLRYIVTGQKPHQFTQVEELMFQAVFDVLEKVYPLYKPKNAENFMFYWHVIRKTAQLIGIPEKVVQAFPLLKNADKHRQKEKLWRRMVEHIGWPYLETKHL